MVKKNTHAGRRAVGVPGLLRNEGLGPGWVGGLLHGNEPPRSKSHSLMLVIMQLYSRLPMHRKSIACLRISL